MLIGYILTTVFCSCFVQVLCETEYITVVHFKSLISNKSSVIQSKKLTDSNVKLNLVNKVPNRLKNTTKYTLIESFILYNANIEKKLLKLFSAI